MTTKPEIYRKEVAQSPEIYRKEVAQSNGKFHDECLSMKWFRNRIEARAIIETWRRHYNEDRPHSSLGYRTPKQFKDEFQQQQPASTHRVILN